MSKVKSLLNDHELGSVNMNMMVEMRNRATKRWESTPFLNGIEDPIRKANIASLYENQLGWMKRNKKIIEESTTSSSSGAFETVAFPIIRKVFQGLLANDIVSIQSLNLPFGKLFYFNPKVSKRRQDPDFAGESAHYPSDSAYGNAARKRAINGGTGLTQYEDESLYYAYYASLYEDYGDALFDRSKGRIKVASGSTDIVEGTLYTDDIIRAKITGFSTTNKGKLVGPSGIPMDTESFVASLRIFPNGTLEADAQYSESNLTSTDTMLYSIAPQKYGQQIVNNSGELTIDIYVTYPGAEYVPFTTGTTDGFTYIYNEYSSLEQDSEMAEVTFDLDEVNVPVETRKMRSQWTPEFATDVAQFHNIDAEAELTALLSETMAAEIDREILRDLRLGAAWTTRWDYKGLFKTTGNFYGVQKDWNQTLITKFNQLSAQIEKATLRGGANWIVVSPEIGAVLNDLEYFHVTDASPDQKQYNMGLESIGSLRGQYQVYKDSYAPANTAIIGRKGTSTLETGYVYAPYVPIELTPTLIHPNDFTNVRGIHSRYAKKLILNHYYGRGVADSLPTFGIGDLR